MVDYEVTVFTGDRAYANTFNNVFIKLVGTDGKMSERKWLFSVKGVLSFTRGAVSLKYPLCLNANRLPQLCLYEIVGTLNINLGNLM